MENSIGIIGGGQLGRMLAFAAMQMGFRITVIDPTPNSPAGQVAHKQIVADFTDEDAIMSVAQKCRYVTFEIELANAKVLDALAERGVSVQPSPQTLSILQDKWRQKTFLSNCRIAIPRFELAHDNAELLLQALQKFGGPIVVKARFGAYDGRGNYVVRDKNDISGALEKLHGKSLYVEEFVPFKHELAVIAAKSIQGEVSLYPVVQTVQQNNICHLVIAPAPIETNVLDQAKELAQNAMEQLEGAGVFGIEMFETEDGQVLVNEIAPRVHNSGHFTIEACRTSQFEQHIRAITGMPLGSTKMLVPAAVMVNILGNRTGGARITGVTEALASEGTSIHIYGKEETRPERKMGHITVTAGNLEDAMQRAQCAREKIGI
jgi:5-(carboxyamino)imidazole ribonucleotide synthase